ncbi:3-keto-5-aminohexanoate cleavage protein [Pseudomonas helleri]|uniref:3-keto-5-aminohexanoate cleavage protein n=1 Tax=Pseudomonas helleri TaxID=1608996 RepID=A0ABW9PDQ3_9PSED|nr:3-keto-5-aminohexanoate cleavage protein [Pseudomonas helleri]MQT25432.1 3-keto-5-aminohexanoate cleavage protein [Pseudomonas helleri]
MSSYILNFSPTGMVPTKQLNVYTPISVSEIIKDVLMAADMGASIAHLHARDAKTGEPTCDLTTFAAIIEGIRQHDRQLILCVSLSGRNIADPTLRALPLTLDGEAKPDMGSLTLSSMNFPAQPSINAPSTIQYLARQMALKGISPEVEIFDTGMSNYLQVLINKQLMPPTVYANILLGNIFGAQPSFAHIAALISALPKEVVSSFAGLGSYQLRSNTLALAAGHGIRIGLEDNIWLDGARTTLASNRSLLQRITAIASHLELTPATPEQVRKQLGLNPGNGRYGLADPLTVEGDA